MLSAILRVLNSVQTMMNVIDVSSSSSLEMEEETTISSLSTNFDSPVRIQETSQNLFHFLTQNGESEFVKSTFVEF